MSAIATVRRRQRGEHEESYFISMTDMMVGLVFVLMIMLVYYALQFHQTTTELTDTVRRTQLLQQLQARLAAEHVNVAIDTDAGVLRLPEEVLFDKGSDVVKPEGVHVLALVGQAMQAQLPCYTVSPTPKGCPATASGLESVFVEGHTDSDQMSGARDNWNLSADRAVNTYRALMGGTPALDGVRNAKLRPADPQPLFGVSGYGPTRPVAANTSEDNKRLNRRIDIRFNMVTPSQAK